MSRDDASILDIARAARLIVQFKQGMDEAAFLTDVKTQSAILHQFMVIGEAVKRLSPTLRDNHPSVPWRLIAGMRDKLIHGYDSVDLGEVWRTAERDIPDLLSAIEPLLPSEEG
jgi:uncharacterized protein with HEPN domain